jgi:hypothetical protein
MKAKRIRSAVVAATVAVLPFIGVLGGGSAVQAAPCDLSWNLTNPLAGSVSASLDCVKRHATQTLEMV